MSCQGYSKKGEKCKRLIIKNQSYCCYHKRLEGGETQFHMRYNKHTKIYQLLRNNIVVYEDHNRKNVEDMFNDLWNMEREEQIRIGMFK